MQKKKRIFFPPHPFRPESPKRPAPAALSLAHCMAHLEAAAQQRGRFLLSEAQRVDTLFFLTLFTDMRDPTYRVILYPVLEQESARG